MFWKNYKTIIGAIIGIIPIVASGFGFHITTATTVDFAGVAVFAVGMLAKDFDK